MAVLRLPCCTVRSMISGQAHPTCATVPVSWSTLATMRFYSATGGIATRTRFTVDPTFDRQEHPRAYILMRRKNMLNLLAEFST